MMVSEARCRLYLDTIMINQSYLSLFNLFKRIREGVKKLEISPKLFFIANGKNAF